MKRLALIFAVLSACMPWAALAGPRVVSLNMCLDQLVLELARPEQILGLSRYARDEKRSFEAKAAQAFPVISGAEQVLFLQPDMVLTSRYTNAQTKAFLARKGVRQERFEAAQTLAQTREQILRMGQLLGNSAGAQAGVARLDAAADALKSQAGRKAQTGRKISVLVLARRGYVSGRASLPGELLALAGVENAGAALTSPRGGFASLETIIAHKPDAILLTDDAGMAEDQGSALLLHPALARLFPPERRLVMPEKLTLCGGPMLAEAMEKLAEQLAKVTPREK